MKESKICKNCDSKLQDLYCSKCGQRDAELLSLNDLFSDFFSNMFSFDSRFFLSLKYLISKPGFLTKEYWSGVRVKYLPPLRIYLIISLLYFAVIPLLADKNPTVLYTKDGESRAFVIDIDDNEPIIFKLLKETMNKGFLQIFKKGTNIDSMIISALSTAMFVLMPLMGFILLLLYKSKQLFYSYHLITVLHFHSFIFLILLLESIPILNLFTPIIIITYSILMLKRVYLESWVKSIVKFILLFIIYIPITVFMQITIAAVKIFFLGYYS